MQQIVVFLKFCSSSVAAFLVDIVAFTFLFHITGTFFFSTYAARVMSASVNFTLNRFLVFRAAYRGVGLQQALKYACLVLCIASSSALLVRYFSGVFSEGLPELFQPASGLIPVPGTEDRGTTREVVLIKLMVDTCLFFVSFMMQRFFVFVRSRSAQQGS